ncbi:hypothetical protein [Thauera sp. 2A1]|uniref:hypothetical protein n=1 Tax=Thauera sp. 2A1 TaxID=2570191 RepID=UPI002106FAF3|nr:hypothetical protein [Thauera sp. 2A1]KAI5913683.1 hypothetical protein GH664_16620 [Thauera sp. 2A1]
MHLLQAGVDIRVIALWLGHESPTTTHQYVGADLVMREQALNQTPRSGATRRLTRWSTSSRPCSYVQAAGIAHHRCARAMTRPAPQLFITGSYA